MPGSKSFTNRALVMAALADGRSTLQYASESDDSIAMINALLALGVKIEKKDSEITVYGRGGSFDPYCGEIDVGPAGTTMRFLVALSILVKDGAVTLKGTEHMHTRPIGDLVDAIRLLGAEVTYLNQAGCPPLLIKAPERIVAREIAMNGKMSSQYFTALLLVAPALPAGLLICVEGEQISQSYIDMTIAGLNSFGATILNNNYRSYEVPATSSYQPSAYTIEGDASGASYLWGLAALSGGAVRIRNLAYNSVQGDVQFSTLLERMGCRVAHGVDESDCSWIEVAGPEKLSGIEADMTLMPDTAQTLAVIAAAAEGTTTLTGLSTLKHKETDRLFALKTELAKLGVHSEITDDSIKVYGGTLNERTINSTPLDTYEDHRMAMSFAVLAARYHGLQIRNPEVVSKSFPDFWKVLESFGVEVQ